MGQTEIRPTLQNTEAYLRYVNHTAFARVRDIASGLEHPKLNSLLADMLGFAATVERKTPIIQGETNEQRTRRQGWMIEAGGIELLDKYGLRKHEQRLLWKEDMVMEIVQAKHEGDIPGVEIELIRSYEDYLDEYSLNRVMATFPAYNSLSNPLHILHVASDFRDIVRNTQNLEKAKVFLSVCDLRSFRPEMTAFTLLNELAILRADLKDKTGTATWQQVKRRLDFFKRLISTDETARASIRVTYRADSVFHAFFIQTASEEGFRGQVPIQIQPEEVDGQFWNFLSTFVSDAVPDRKTCIGIGRRNQQDESSEASDPDSQDEEDWGYKRRKVKTPANSRFQRKHKSYGDEEE